MKVLQYWKNIINSMKFKRIANPSIAVSVLIHLLEYNDDKHIKLSTLSKFKMDRYYKVLNRANKLKHKEGLDKERIVKLKYMINTIETELARWRDINNRLLYYESKKEKGRFIRMSKIDIKTAQAFGIDDQSLIDEEIDEMPFLIN